MFSRSLRNVRRILTLGCDDHRRLQAMRFDGRLSMSDRMAMWGHWIACGPCRRWVGQLLRIDELAALSHRADGVESEPSLSVEARERITKRLVRASRGGSNKASVSQPPQSE